MHRNKSKNILDKVQYLENQFAANNYNGKCSSDYKIEQGSIPIMVSVPHAVNHFRGGSIKVAEVMTGGIARYLHEINRCHLIYAGRQAQKDPNYDEETEGDYKTTLKRYIEDKDIKVLIDLHGAAGKWGFAVEMGTIKLGESEDISLCGQRFVGKVIANSLDNSFKGIQSTEKKEIWKNKMFTASHQHTITNYISRNTNVACVQLEVNRIFRSNTDEECIVGLINGLNRAILTLGEVDWTQGRQIAVEHGGNDTNDI